MVGVVSSRRYAQAVFQIALEKDDLDGWLDDLTVLTAALDNREFAEFLNSPQISVSQKVGVIRDALGGTVNHMAMNLLSLLAYRSLAHVLPNIVDQYQGLLDIHLGVERVEVISAIPLGDEHRLKVVELLKGIVGKEIRLTSRVDVGVKGGLVARVGDRIIDGSLRTKLRSMRRELVEQVS